MKWCAHALMALVVAVAGLAVSGSPAAGANAGTLWWEVDGVTSPEPGLLRVRGWIFDENAPSSPAGYHLYIGGPAGDPNAMGYDLGVTDQSRPDVQAAYPGSGPTTGFDKTIEVPRFGSQPVYLYAINVPGTAGGNAFMYSQNVQIADPSPSGYLEPVTSPGPGQIRVSGYAAEVDPTLKVRVAFRVDGAPVGTLVADQRFPYGSGTPYEMSGFGGTFAVSGGRHEVCATAINQGRGGDRAIGCSAVDVQAPPLPPAPVVAPPVPPPVPLPSGGESAPRITLRLKAITKKSRLKVDIGPDLSPSNYRFKVQRRTAGKWRTIKRTQTLGPRDLMVLDLRRGRYRVVVPRQHDLAAARETIRLKR